MSDFTQNWPTADTVSPEASGYGFIGSLLALERVKAGIDELEGSGCAARLRDQTV